MIGSTLKQALIEQMDEREGPVLSLYLDVHPSGMDGGMKAVALRAAEAMRGAGLDPDYVGRVKARLTLDHGRPEGRSLVVFAGADPEEAYDAYSLQSRLPFLAATDGVLAHWGRPLVAPLLFALDQHERYAVVYAAADRVRVFEAFLGQIEEISDHVRSADPEQWRDYRQARGSPGVGLAVASRGGADVDRFRDRMEEATARLYRNLLPELERRLEEERVDRVIVMGVPGNAAAFKDAMGKSLQERVVATLPPPANPDAPPREWLPFVTDTIAAAEAEHEQKLVDRLREEGVGGVDECLAMLQDGRLHLIVVPWSTSVTVYRGSDGRVAASAEEARALAPEGGEPEALSLIEILPELVRSTGTRLELVEGAAEERLVEELGGMAGLRRW